jgi:hypothetical protein
MKSLRYVCMVLTLSSAIGAATVMADNTKSVVLVNNTPYTLENFYASDSTSPDFSTTDLLSGQTVAPGQQLSVNINDDSSDCGYDLMAILYGATQYAYQYAVNVCGGATWTITVE